MSDTHRAATPSVRPPRVPAASAASQIATDPPRMPASRPPRITAVGVFPDPPFGLVTAIRTDRGQVACRMDRTLCRCASSSFPGFGVARPRLSTLSTVRRRPHSAGGSGGAGGTHPPSASTSVDPDGFLREPVPRHHRRSGSGSGGRVR